jgi:hypothetical protein
MPSGMRVKRGGLILILIFLYCLLETDGDAA